MGVEGWGLRRGLAPARSEERRKLPIWVCAVKTWSMSSAYEHLRAQHPLRAEM